MKRTGNTTGKNILVSDLRREDPGLRRKTGGAIRRVLASGWYVLGGELEAFEEEFARYSGSSHAVGVASGTEALQLVLAALSIGEGDEVITAVNTAIPTAMAIAAAGAVPKFVDVDEETFNIDCSKIEKAITPRTRAIIPVHLYGRMCDIDSVLKIAKRRGLRVIEDACQAHGASYKGRKAGTFGDAGCFSFYPTKNLGCYGDGGIVVTDNGRIAGKLRLLRNYGQPTRYECSSYGINSRLDELQAAVLREKLKLLDRRNSRRIWLAELYGELLKDIPGVSAPAAGKEIGSVYHLYVIRCEDRDGLKRYLRKAGIETQIHYPVPLHLQKPFRRPGSPARDFPAAERLSRSILTLPIFPELRPAEVEYICRRIRDYYGYTKRPVRAL